MGRIVVKFDGLNLFFLEKLMKKSGKFRKKASLMVGMIGVDGKMNCSNNDPANPLPWCGVIGDDEHTPKVLIFEVSIDADSNLTRKLIVERRAFGDIFFYSPETIPAIRNYTAGLYEIGLATKIASAKNSIVLDATKDQEIPEEISEEKLKEEKNIVPEDYKDYTEASSFHIARMKDFNPDASQSKPIPDRCAARLHFNTGTLFSIDEKSFDFGKPKGTSSESANPNETIPISTSVFAGLEIVIPQYGGMKMIYSNQVPKDEPPTLYQMPPVDFNPSKDYEVQFINNSKNSRGLTGANHFLYYYSVFEPVPQKFITPVTKPEIVVVPNRNSSCTPAGTP